MTEPTTQQKAEATAAEAQRLAAVAADAALTEQLDSIKHVREFIKLADGNSFDSAKLKSSYISKFGFKRFEALCGRSH